MKKIFSILCAFIISGVAIAQTQLSVVTVNVTGNRTKQIGVDNKYYTIQNRSLTEKKALVINNLENGQHTLDIVGVNQYNKTSSYKTSFTLRQGYNLVVNINSTGTVSLSEKRNEIRSDNAGISNAAFNKLYAATKKKNSSVSRAAFLENELTNTNKRFTAAQASRLIQLVNSENLRFKLAKQSYLKVTDKQNFSLVANLLKSNNNKNELTNYMSTVSDEDDMDDDNALLLPLTDEKFGIIYNEVLSESTPSDKNYYLSNFFSKDFNYYTSSQARELIQLINTEAGRFDLAKSAYRGIVDRQNYSEVYQLLSNTANRAALLAYTRSFDNENTGPSMSNAEFSKLYKSVYNQTSANRYYTINNALLQNGNYFTTAQAKQLIQLVNEESSRLQLLKTGYKVLTDKANYAQLNDLLSSSYNRNEFATYVANYDNGFGVSGAVAMSEADYNNLYRSVNVSWSSSTRFNLVTAAFNNNKNYFSTYQVRQLLLLIIAEPDRLSLAKIAYDNVVDLNNYTQLYGLFNSSANKNDLAKFVSDMQYGSGTVIKTPMTEAEFNTIYKDIQYKFGIGAKMSALTVVFNTELNYFTVQQAKQLIQMVSAEYNRLELAKLSYNNITDPMSFSQMYDIFSTQTSKDELAAYVGSSASLNK